MEIAGLPVPAGPERRPSVLDRPPRNDPGRHADRATELPAGGTRQEAAEHVLQGEFLQKQRDRAPENAKTHADLDARREDHPAFQRRYANDALIQRRAVAAYQAHFLVQDTAAGTRSRIDYFV